MEKSSTLIFLYKYPTYIQLNTNPWKCTRTNENCSKKRYYLAKPVCQYIFTKNKKRKKRKNYDTEYPKNYLHKQAKNVRLKSIIKYYFFMFPIILSAKSIKKCTFKIYSHFSI